MLITDGNKKRARITHKLNTSTNFKTKIMELVVVILGVLNVALAIFNKKAKNEVRIFNAFAGVFCIVVWFVMMT